MGERTIYFIGRQHSWLMRRTCLRSLGTVGQAAPVPHAGLRQSGKGSPIPRTSTSRIVSFCFNTSSILTDEVDYLDLPKLDVFKQLDSLYFNLLQQRQSRSELESSAATIVPPQTRDSLAALATDQQM